MLGMHHRELGASGFHFVGSPVAAIITSLSGTAVTKYPSAWARGNPSGWVTTVATNIVPRTATVTSAKMIFCMTISHEWIADVPSALRQTKRRLFDVTMVAT
jgi:hypothetical protein